MHTHDHPGGPLATVFVIANLVIVAGAADRPDPGAGPGQP